MKLFHQIKVGETYWYSNPMGSVSLPKRIEITYSDECCELHYKYVDYQHETGLITIGELSGLSETYVNALQRSIESTKKSIRNLIEEEVIDYSALITKVDYLALLNESQKNLNPK